jgi:hypothetical protein
MAQKFSLFPLDVLISLVVSDTKYEAALGEGTNANNNKKHTNFTFGKQNIFQN